MFVFDLFAETSDTTRMKPYADNRYAAHAYECLKTLEGGLALLGAETKSIRENGMRLRGAYLRIEKGELWLIGSHIAMYSKAAAQDGYEPDRPRKVLVHKQELHFLAEKTHEKGLTLIPFSVYPSKRRIKLSFGVCRGKNVHDKRESIKQREVTRSTRRVMRGEDE